MINRLSLGTAASSAKFGDGQNVRQNAKRSSYLFKGADSFSAVHSLKKSDAVRFGQSDKASDTPSLSDDERDLQNGLWPGSLAEKFAALLGLLPFITHPVDGLIETAKEKPEREKAEEPDAD